MATASLNRPLTQMAETAENSAAIFFGYHVVASVLAIMVMPMLVGGEMLYIVLGDVVMVASLAGIALMVWGLVRHVRLAWQWCRYVVLFGSVLRVVVSIAYVVIQSNNNAEGLGLLPHGAVGVFLAKVYGGSMTPFFTVMLFLVDIGTTIAGFVLFAALSNKRTLAYFDLICPECNTRTKKATDFFFRKAKCRACQHTW